MNKYPAVPLGEICEIISGATPKTNIEEYWGTEINWVTPKDLSNLQGKYIQSTPRKLTKKGLDSCPAVVLPKGSVLLSSRAPIGHVAINGTPMATNQGFKSLIPSPEKVSANYLYHWLRANREKLESLGNGATFKEISKSTVSKIEIPLPPLQQQEKAAIAIDQVDSLRTKRRRSVELLNELTESIFFDMFGDITNSKMWEFGRVSDLVSHFKSGKSLSPASDETNSKYHILKISAVTSGTFKPEESKGAPPEHNPPASHFVQQGDLLFSRANTLELIGATALVDSPQDNLLLPDKLWRFVWHDEPKADPVYIDHMFSQGNFRDAVRANSTGSSGSMKNISQKKVLSIPCALPPLPLQKEFAEKARKIQEIKREQMKHLSHLDELFASVQQRAFDGTLWDDRDITV
ncbi:restriction endonuclease subunit S [Nocardiopsis sp. HUAS JQ3]|uniref:restriction endonuclease subunit S n=1 Tax=Nocardiopsis sp. HUAS JQ3 TaxID=3061629 RepID=UPI0023A9C152|nr:restriction endonuclease subunit S [Nocardiopsis sp. HUAS JQ3]WDZ90703.1 restriction endonuclease subunit S [Nocardiopsis sp. HUAS JQ3]